MAIRWGHLLECITSCLGSGTGGFAPCNGRATGDSAVCTCIDGRYQVDAQTCSVCSIDIPNCAECTHNSTCAACFSGFHLALDGSSCTQCETGCAGTVAASGVEVTRMLLGDRHFGRWVCICTSDGYRADNKTCNTCGLDIPLCTSCTGPENCTRCTFGYFLTSSNTCTSCPIYSQVNEAGTGRVCIVSSILCLMPKEVMLLELANWDANLVRENPSYAIFQESATRR